MRLLMLAFALAVTAAASAPRLREAPTDERAWPVTAVRTASLGRPLAAAELAWLKTIQLIGSADYERRGFPTLDDWLDVITSLDPSFDDPYLLGATLYKPAPASLFGGPAGGTGGRGANPPAGALIFYTLPSEPGDPSDAVKTSCIV